jgi:very-short-patch-repair endonuclease
MAGAPETSHSHLRAACFAGMAPIAVSHRSAAALYSVPWGRRHPIEITCRRWERTTKGGLVVHEFRRFGEQDIGEIDGIPVVTGEFLLIQLAWLRPNPNYLEAAIHALRRGRHITYDSATATFDRYARRGLRGVVAMREAFGRWRPGDAATHSEPETDLIQLLRKHGIHAIAQFRVHDEHGRFVAQVDAGLPQWRITVEYESDQEHLDEFQIARDDRRRNDIVAAGYWPLSVRKHDLRRGALDLVEQIRSIARRSA